MEAILFDNVKQAWENNAPLWTKLARDGQDILRDHINTPAFLEALPDVAQKRGIDIGCGEGTNTCALARRGASLVAVDIAPSFVAAARALFEQNNLAIDVREADAAQLPFADHSFDFATAFMCLMDCADAGAAFAEAHRVVRPGGFFQFSILHPCFGAFGARNVKDDRGEVIGRVIYNYFSQSNGAPEDWMFNAAKQQGETRQFHVPRFDRPLGAWFDLVAQAGWQLEALIEPRPSEASVAKLPELKSDLMHPNFMILRLRKLA